jgi:hypothetical protein
MSCGPRDGELSHLIYGDIDVRHSVWKVRAKEDHNLKTKGSRRDVPVGEWLTAKEMTPKKADARQDGDLIFGERTWRRRHAPDSNYSAHR